MNKLKLSLALSMIPITCSHAALVYVDAEYNGNTINAATDSATDWAIDPAVNANGAPGTDNLWGQRTTGPAGPLFGTNGWQISSTETGPTLITFATGLLPDTTYGGLRIYFTGKEATSAGNQWFIDASVDGVNFDTYGDDATNSVAVDISNGGVGAPVAAGATTDNRYYASLPNGVTDSSGNLNVWVRQGTGADNRSVYDGFAFDNTPIPEPSSSLLAMVSLLVVARRRR